MSDNKNKMPLGIKNYKYMLVSLALVIIGFALMTGGASDNPNEYNAEELFSFRRITLSVIFVLAGLGGMIYGIMKRSE